MPFGIGSVLGGASALGSLFGGRGGKGNPADAAQPYLNQIDPMVKSYLEPYMGEGREADTRARGIYQSIPDLYSNIPGARGGQFQDPRDFLNKLIEGYEPSTGYKYNEKKLLGAARNSAASGGILGTQFDQENQQDIMRGLLGQDQQQYLNNIFGILQGRGQGLGQQGLYEGTRGERGFNAASDLANILGSNSGQKANLAFQGQRQNLAQQQERSQNRSNLFGNVLGAVGSDFVPGGQGWFRGGR